MKIISREETITWCHQNEIVLTARGQPELTDATTQFKIPVDAQKRVYLASQDMRAFASEPLFLVWFDDWAFWPSGQRMHIFDRFRMSYGESRRLIDSPGHIFDREEIEDAISFVTFAVLFLWDCYVVSPKRSKLLFFSHDEYGLTKGFTIDKI
jgi:hypothetical protein